MTKFPLKASHLKIWGARLGTALSKISGTDVVFTQTLSRENDNHKVKMFLPDFPLFLPWQDSWILLVPWAPGNRNNILCHPHIHVPSATTSSPSSKSSKKKWLIEQTHKIGFNSCSALNTKAYRLVYYLPDILLTVAVEYPFAFSHDLASSSGKRFCKVLH